MLEQKRVERGRNLESHMFRKNIAAARAEENKRSEGNKLKQWKTEQEKIIIANNNSI